MANTDSPNGFTPVKHLTGGTMRSAEMRIADDYNTAIFNGDMVKLAADGTIEVASAGNRVVGVFAGCKFTKDDGAIVYSKHWPASQSVLGSYATAYVYTDPNIVYRAQSSGASGIADIGQLADMISTHAGSTTTGRSGQEVNTTTGTGTAQVRILEFINDGANDPASDNAEMLVVIHEHEYNQHIDADGTPGV